MAHRLTLADYQAANEALAKRLAALEGVTPSPVHAAEFVCDNATLQAAGETLTGKLIEFAIAIHVNVPDTLRTIEAVREYLTDKLGKMPGATFDLWVGHDDWQDDDE